MAKEAGEILIGSNGSIYHAPLGSPIPASISAPLDPAFAELGFATDDGVRLLDARETGQVDVWQSFYTPRRFVVSKDFSGAFTLLQWNSDTMTLAFGGGTVTEDVPGEFTYTPPPPEQLDERFLAVEWSDGDKDYRVLIPKGLVTEDVEIQVARSGPSQLPVTFTATPTGAIGEEPWLLQSNDTSWTPTGS